MRVSQEVRNDDGDETEDRIVRVLNKGDYFGEQALLSGNYLRATWLLS